MNVVFHKLKKNINKTTPVAQNTINLDGINTVVEKKKTKIVIIPF
jgi:hypothetical protein